MDDGYLINSLRLWKAERQREHRLLMARYARLEGSGSPILSGQGTLIDLNWKIIEQIDAALAKAIGGRHG